MKNQVLWEVQCFSREHGASWIVQCSHLGVANIFGPSFWCQGQAGTVSRPGKRDFQPWVPEVRDRTCWSRALRWALEPKHHRKKGCCGTACKCRFLRSIPQVYLVSSLDATRAQIKMCLFQGNVLPGALLNASFLLQLYLSEGITGWGCCRHHDGASFRLWMLL